MNLKKAFGIGERASEQDNANVKGDGRVVKVVGMRRPLKPRLTGPVNAQPQENPHSSLSRPPDPSSGISGPPVPKSGERLDQDGPVASSSPDFEPPIPSLPSQDVHIECPCFVRMRVGAHSYIVRMVYEFSVSILLAP